MISKAGGKRDCRLSTIRIEDHLYVHLFSAGDDVDHPYRAKAIAALKAGKEVGWPDGHAQWVEHNPIVDLSKEGSEMYEWDTTGNRIRHETLLHTKVGEMVECERVGLSYRKW